MSVTVTPDAIHDDAPSINMSSRNAHEMFALLGIDLGDDWSGQLPAADFLGRVLIAQGLAGTATDDTLGRPAVTERSPSGRAAYVDGGRRPGYVGRRLAELHEAATWALGRQVDVVWY